MKKHKLYRYYSQYGEDFILWNFFDYKDKGYFIDVGAFDGKHLSNSYSFEQQGWKGICVEPVSGYFKLCETNRPGSVCVQAACVSSEDIKEIELEVDDTGLFSSSKIDINAKNIKGHYNILKKEISIRKEKVKATTLNSVLINEKLKEQAIDFISIDVEGAEIEVLKGIDLQLYAPRIIVIETNTVEDKEQIQIYLVNNGYTFGREVRANSYFVRDLTDLKKIQNIVVTCSIEKQMHPLGEDYTIGDYSKGIFYFEGEKSDLLLRTLNAELASLKKLIEKRNELILTQADQVDKSKEQLKKERIQLEDLSSKIKIKDELIQDQIVRLKVKDDYLEEQNERLRSKDEQLKINENQLEKLNKNLKEKDVQLRLRDERIEQKNQELDKLGKVLNEKTIQLEEKEDQIRQKLNEIDALTTQMKESELLLKDSQFKIDQYEEQLNQYLELLKQKDFLINQQEENIKSKDQKLLIQEDRISQIKSSLEMKELKINQDTESLALKEIQIGRKEDQVKQSIVLQEQKDALINQQVELLKLNAQKLRESENLLKSNEKLLMRKDQELNQKINELAIFYNSYTYKIIRLILGPSRLVKLKKKK